SVHDAGWSQFVAMLQYKAQRYGRILIKIGRFVPTSQTCHVCDRIDGPKPLHIREWTCPGCHAVHDRDINAAINVKKAAGLGGHSLWSAGKTTAPVVAQRSEAGSHGLPDVARVA
ncbi:zinc ribbon domain-containing protein, partial [Streptomyces sp. NPDC051453]|uniref:zinc ribbon domain-containing protein n=1 Tax=Streptomyces sp. NPDC051453 TaxID=3154941 RepID=UPI0034137D48